MTFSKTKTLKLAANGRVLTLPILTDEEFDQVEQDASKRLDRCPTCEGRRFDGESAGKIDATERHYGRVEGQYRYRGEIHECECDVQMALYRHFTAAGIGEQYMRLDWAADYKGDTEVKRLVDHYVDRWRAARQNGLGVTLWSDGLGVGKTFAATHIAKAMIKHGQKVKVIHFRDIVSTALDGSVEQQDTLFRVSFLIIDEVWFTPNHSEARKALFGEHFERLIRYRTDHNLPTILTSNFSPDQLSEHWPRIYSLLEAKQLVIEFHGQDYRAGTAHIENIEMFLDGECRPIV